MALTLGIEAEQATAHLTILGWWPIRWNKWNRTYVGIRNNAQYARVQWNRVLFDPVWENATEKPCEWRELTDHAVLTLAATIDNTLIGWGE